MDPTVAPVGSLLALVATFALFGVVYWDATRVGVSRPLLWATIAAGAFAVGVWLYLFVPAAPLTGAILTANAGLVLYTFEREVATDEGEALEPGALPGRSGGPDRSDEE